MADCSEPHGWEINTAGPEAYERYIVPAWMGEWAQALVESSGIIPGERVLDVACGTGIVARKAASVVGTSGKVVGIDVSEGMLRVARQCAEQENIPTIDWHCGDASHLPFDQAEYDVVLCQHGLQFFPNRSAALREMARVLVPGGRLAISVWRALGCSPYFAVLANAIENNLGAESAAVLHASCSLSDREELRNLVSDAGFRDIRIRLEVKVGRHPSFETFLHGHLSVFPIAASIAAMQDADRIRMFNSISASLQAYMDDSGLAAPMECHVLTANKSA